MATVAPGGPPGDWTFGDISHHLGDIPLERIRVAPLAGTATEADLLRVAARTGRIYELVDGILVEKCMGAPESILAGFIVHLLWQFLESNDLGTVLAPDGLVRILPQQIRAPDVSLVRWERFPDRQLPKKQVFAVAPDLVIEILSPGNTRAEMERKLREYFAAGVRLVWYIDPETRTARAYTSQDQFAEFGHDGVLSGGDVLPGFELPLGKVFAKLQP